MKAIKTILTSVTLALTLGFAATAQEAADKAPKKERTTQGVLVCAKCSLKKTESCQAALTIDRKNKQGKQIKRVFLLKNNEVAQAFHKNICSGDKVPVKVTGIREGKRPDITIVASKIEKVKAKAKKKDA